MPKYIFHAAALAAHFRFSTGHHDFGHEYSSIYLGDSPHAHHTRTGGRTGPEISFTDSFVSLECKEEKGVYLTVAKSGLENFNVKDVVTADALECGIETVYREAWRGNPKKPKYARILPQRPVFRNLKICGEPYELERQLKPPAPFLFDAAQREEYFEGDNPEIEPQGISAAPGRRMRIKGCGEIRISADTRRITIPKFGIVYFADWMWQPPDVHTAPKTYQWVQLVKLQLKNPGSGGGAGVGGNGTT
jgi:hypothetical protein